MTDNNVYIYIYIYILRIYILIVIVPAELYFNVCIYTVNNSSKSDY